MSEVRKLFREFLRTDSLNMPLSIDDWLVGACERALDKPPEVAPAYALTNSQRIFNAFGRLNDEVKLRGRRAAFEVVDPDRRLVRAFPQDQGSQADLRLRRLDRRCEALRWIDSLTDREFEFLGALVAEFIGAKRTLVTPPGDEGGVDFYALVPVMGPSDILHGVNRELRIVGQSKQYATPVAVDKLREFSDVIDTIRKRGRYMDDKVPSWFDDHHGPIVGWIMGSSGFQSGCWTLARERGIVLSDDRDIAENLLTCRQLPPVLEAGQLSAILSAKLSKIVDRPEHNRHGASRT